MTIRIPSAYDAGFGQKLAETPKIPLSTGRELVGEAIGQGGLRLGGQLADMALEQKAHEDKLRLIEDEKLAKAQALETRSRAQVDLLNLQGELSQGSKAIADRQDLDIEGKKAAFNEHLKGIEERFKSAIPKELQVEFEPDMAKSGIITKSGFSDTLTRQAEDKTLAEGMEALTMLEQMAADSPAQRGAFKESASALIDTLPMDEVKKTAQKQVFASKLDSNDVLTRMTSGDLNALLTDLKKDTEYTGLQPDDRVRYTAQTQDAIERATREKKAEARAQEAAFRDRARETLDSYKEWKLAGLPVSPKEEDRIARLVKGTEYESRYIALKTQGESAAYILGKLADDPLTFGAARLGVQVPPLPLDDPQRLTQGIAQRLAVGDKVKAAHGMTFTPLLTSDEVKGLSSWLKKDAGAGIDFMDKLSKQIGQKNATGLAMQMAKEAPELSTVMRYAAAGDTATARTIANGQELIRTKALKMPPESDMSAFFYDEAGDSLKGMPNNANEVYEAFRAVYASQAQAAGVQDGTFDRGRDGWFGSDGLAVKAFKQIVGEQTEVNGFKVVLPKGVNEDTFLNSVKRIDGGWIKAIGGVTGMPDEVAALAIRKEGQFYLAGDGVYRVIVNGSTMLKKDGKPLQFSIKGNR